MQHDVFNIFDFVKNIKSENIQGDVDTLFCYGPSNVSYLTDDKAYSRKDVLNKADFSKWDTTVPYKCLIYDSKELEIKGIFFIHQNHGSEKITLLPEPSNFEITINDIANSFLTSPRYFSSRSDLKILFAESVALDGQGYDKVKYLVEWRKNGDLQYKSIHLEENIKKNESLDFSKLDSSTYASSDSKIFVHRRNHANDSQRIVFYAPIDSSEIKYIIVESKVTQNCFHAVLNEANLNSEEVARLTQINNLKCFNYSLKFETTGEEICPEISDDSKKMRLDRANEILMITYYLSEWGSKICYKSESSILTPVFCF